MRKLFIASLAALLFLPGCASSRTAGTSVLRLPAGALASDSMGVVLFSTGSPESRVGYVTYLLVYPQGSRETVRRSPMIPVDLFSEKSNFADHHGTVHALQLRPGSYYLSTFTSTARTRVRPTLLFDVRAGETTYIGEVLMSPVQGGRTVVIRDAYDRDIAVAREKNPAIQGQPVVRRLMQRGPEQTFGR